MNNQAELIDWLRDAYAMETALETALKKLTDHPEDHPALLREHAALQGTETRRHADAVATCLRRLGSDTSSLNAVLLQGMDFMRSTGTAFIRDERIKDVLTVLVTAHFEIASHDIIRTGSSQLGLQEIASTCDAILLEKKSMVKWLQLHLPQIITTYVAPEETEEEEAMAADFAVTRHDPAKGREQWEFVQLAQNASLFGGPLPRSTTATASMLS